MIYIGRFCGPQIELRLVSSLAISAQHLQVFSGGSAQSNASGKGDVFGYLPPAVWLMRVQRLDVLLDFADSASASLQPSHPSAAPEDMFGGLSTGQHAHSSAVGNGDMFGGLNTAQPSQSNAAGAGDMFGGLSLGTSDHSASSAPQAGPAKHPQAAAAPFDADLFGGGMNGQSMPMGIPQQVRC